MNNDPLVSIIMATWNRAHFIEETLQAINSQSYINWECLIIDDGGTDNTLELITPILEEDKRFTFLKRTKDYKKGLPGCRNYGLDRANGDFIIFFDDDDIPHPQNLELCVDELKDGSLKFCRYPKAVFRGDFDYKFDYKKKFEKFKFTQNNLTKMIDQTIPFYSCSAMWSTSCFENNRFNESLMYAEEWECYSRILSQEIKGICIEKTLFYARKHPNSNTGEFLGSNPIRRDSKKKAIQLIVNHLSSKKLLTPYLLKYLSGIAITFRDIKLIDNIIKSVSLSKKQKFKLRFKFYAYPIWVIYAQIKKSFRNKLNKN